MTRSHPFLKCTLSGSAILMLLACSHPASTDPTSVPHYTITDLNILLRTGEVGPHSINAAGEIVGTFNRKDGRQVGFLYKKGILTELLGQEGTEAEGVAINNKGQAVGNIRFANGREVAVVWKIGKVQTLPPFPSMFGFPGGGSVAISGINDQGQIIGSTPGDEGTSAFLWQAGKIAESQQVSIGVQSDKAPDGKITKSNVSLPTPLNFQPTSLNAKGQVVGFSQPGMGGNALDHAILWENYKEQDLGILPGGVKSHANSINDRGQVVGFSTSPNIYDQASTWVDHAVLWENGQIRDLGTCGGRNSEAYAINNRGQVVGKADRHYVEMVNGVPTNIGIDRAILWMNGYAYNLTDLLPKDSGWLLERALAINDRGQIVGIGYHTKDGDKLNIGPARAFLLTPR